MEEITNDVVESNVRGERWIRQSILDKVVSYKIKLTVDTFWYLPFVLSGSLSFLFHPALCLEKTWEGRQNMAPQNMAVGVQDMLPQDMKYAALVYWLFWAYRHLKNSKCRERLTLNSLYLAKDRSSKGNSIVINPLPRSFINQGRLRFFSCFFTFFSSLFSVGVEIPILGRRASDKLCH